MRFAFLILYLSVFSIQSLMAQNKPGEVIIISHGVEMMPYEKGACTINSYYDEGFTNTLQQHTVDLYEEKINP
ncbi:MAG: hypothetical protein U5Q03_05700 [Bacteroidota bacterium]|nr:hypothetical protein [Bacteroidota bacterium]